LQKVNLFGINLSNLYTHELEAIIHTTIKNKDKKHFSFTAVNALIDARKNNLLPLYNKIDYVLADGKPLVWASKFLGTPIVERLTGLDFTPNILEIAHKHNYSVYFFGASPGIASKLEAFAKLKYPNFNSAGFYTPPFKPYFTQEDSVCFINEINQSKPDILLVSLTAPKQDIWVQENIHLLNTKVIMSVGGAFEVTAGIKSRSPKFMQKNGLEWFYRFLQDPKRLFKRYFIQAPLFFPLVIDQKLFPNKYIKN
jgi:N-acetylglucosaminyldiphosphoundecaprenol N-acetyl-beta-D-mannosaminyltransferase